MRVLTEDEELILGEKLISIFSPPKSEEYPDRVILHDGYGTKTKLGVARTIIGVINDIMDGECNLPQLVVLNDKDRNLIKVGDTVDAYPRNESSFDRQFRGKIQQFFRPNPKKHMVHIMVKDEKGFIHNCDANELKLVKRSKK